MTMDQFSATDAALAGFRAAREKPRTVAIWAGLMAILSFVVAIIVVSTFGDQLTALTEALEGEPDPQTTLAAMSGMWPLFLGSILYVLATNSVLLAAVNRLILRPQDGARAYLRVGGDELRQALVQVLLYLVLFVGVIAVAILLAVGSAVGGQGLGMLLGLVAGLGLMAGMIVLTVRLSFVSTLAFDTGRIDLGASWEMTKGRFWPLLGAYLIASVLAVVVYLLLFVMIAAVGAIAALAMGGGLASVGDALQHEANTLSALLSVSGVIRSLLSGLMSVLLSLIVFAPAPTIYAQLKGRDAGAA
jgi:MFS family permease